jgi:hypothetical protein
MIDNIVVNDGTADIFTSDGTNMAKFYAHETQSGCWWQEPWVYNWFVFDLAWLPDWGYYYTAAATDPSWGVYDPDWIYTIYPPNLDTAIRWDIPSQGLWKAWMQLDTYYDTDNHIVWGGFDTDSNDTLFIEAKSDTETTWTELSRDYGSANDDYYGGALSLASVIANDFIYHSSKYLALDSFMEDTEKASLQFRFVSDEAKAHGYAGAGLLNMQCLYGMRDVTPPISQASMTGTFDEECHWYTSPVTITVTATDDLTGVCTIYYELDGVVHEYIMPVVVNTDGTHTFCYWAVDCEGNVEAKKCLPEFRIDLTGPTVQITGPATGYLYLFGNQLFALKSGKTIFLFNGIPVTATATSTDAGIATVQFFLDDVLMTEDTTAPYAARLSTKHSGPATIKVTAIDVLGHSASDTLNIDNYLKLF